MVKKHLTIVLHDIQKQGTTHNLRQPVKAERIVPGELQDILQNIGATWSSSLFLKEKHGNT